MENKMASKEIHPTSLFDVLRDIAKVYGFRSIKPSPRFLEETDPVKQLNWLAAMSKSMAHCGQLSFVYHGLSAPWPFEFREGTTVERVERFVSQLTEDQRAALVVEHPLEALKTMIRIVDGDWHPGMGLGRRRYKYDQESVVCKVLPPTIGTLEKVRLFLLLEVYRVEKEKFRKVFFDDHKVMKAQHESLMNFVKELETLRARHGIPSDDVAAGPDE